MHTNKSESLSSQGQKIAVIIPSFNEKDNICTLIDEVFALFRQAKVVVVDDNSPDGTAGAVSQLKDKYKNLILLVRKNKRGRGSAVIEGLRLAYNKFRVDLFIEMDADRSHDPQEIKIMLDLANSKTVVIGSRYLCTSKIINWPLARKISSQIANWLIRLVLGLSIADNTNGFRLYPREAVKVLINHSYISRGYILLSESAYVLLKHGFVFAEFPSVFINRIAGKSNASVKEFFLSLVNLWRIRLHGKYV